MSKILFSPLGMTDPVSHERDGAMLHICRYNNIDKVYLYMSKEICERNEKDHCYKYCIDKLSELLGHSIEAVEIHREDLSQVQVFDFFIDEFRREIAKIYENEPDCELYLNVSSGTPSMKSALQALAAFSEKGRMIPVQVSTPKEKSNPRFDNTQPPEEMWKKNEDNTSPKNRTSLSGSKNFLTEIKKQMLSSLINKYDYSGALTLAEEMEDQLPEKFIKLLKGASKRIALEENAVPTLKKNGFLIHETDPSDEIIVMEEYLLTLEIKCKKREYGDFLRGITPLIADIFEVILREKLNFNINNYSNEQNGVRKWDAAALKTNQTVWDALNKKYERRGGMGEGPIYSDNLLVIIKTLSKDQRINSVCDALRKVEGKIRNMAAHEIVRVSKGVIKNRTYLSTDEIVHKLTEALSFVDANARKDDFLDSYDKMNDILLKELNMIIDDEN